MRAAGRRAWLRLTTTRRQRVALLVAAGYLDRWSSDWYRRVDVRALRMSSATRCVLGQVFGRYSRGMNELYGSYPMFRPGEAAFDTGFPRRLWVALVRDLEVAEVADRPRERVTA